MTGLSRLSKGKDERGAVIVEATIVFPVVFLVIFFLIFAGNAYLQKCRVEAIVTRMATEGAAYCADPMLDDIQNGSVPTDADVRPYRYLVGGMSDIEYEIESEAGAALRQLGTGLFSHMEPSIETVDVRYNNGFLYSTFSVDARYKIRIPVKLPGASDFISMHLDAHCDVPVSDSPEFIRNVDTVEDYMEKYGVTEKINHMIEKAKEWIE